MTPLFLGVAWGVMVAVPVGGWARRLGVSARARELRATPRRRRFVLVVPPSLHRVLGVPARRRRRRREEQALLAELPVAVDLLGVAVAAGSNPFQAVELVARYGPRAVAAELDRALRSCAAGAGFDDALREVAARRASLRSVVDALRANARLGAPVAPALARVAAEVRADVRRRAESRARTIPVRLCFPLVGCVLPAFALLTVAPVVLQSLTH